MIARASNRGTNRGVGVSDRGINCVSSDGGINCGACERRTNEAPAPGKLPVPVDEALLGVPATRAPVCLKVPQVALDVGPRER